VNGVTVADLKRRRELEGEVLRLLGKWGPLSGRALAGKLGRRRSDVQSAILRLERRGAIRWSPGASKRSPTGSWELLPVREGGSRRPRKPRISRHVPDVVLEDIVAHRVDPYEWAQRELEKRGKWAA
jgi:DNA-binding transcriptional MocR family regulator